MKLVKPSEVNGNIVAPSSKSFMQRAVAVATLTNGKTLIKNPCFSDDCVSALKIAKALGSSIDIQKNLLSIEGGKDGKLPKNTHLDCGESGLCLRMFSPIAGLFGKEFVLTGHGSLLKRPVGFIEKPLNELGANCMTNKGFLPVKISGRLKGGMVEVDGSISSQFLTGLLIALPLCKNDSHILVKNLHSKPYIEMTLSVLKKFGATISNKNLEEFFILGGQSLRQPVFRVEGDWSSAAFLLAAGAIAGKTKVKGISKKSLQADKAILDALQKAGAEIKFGKDFVIASKKELNAFEFDATDCPDLVPVLIALASNCKGTSTITGTQRLKHKESNRAQALLEEFTKIGAKIRLTGNEIRITGSKITGGRIFSHNDHRIAMACAIAGLNSEKGVEISGFECVSKSYPEFFNDLGKLTGRET